MFLRKALKEKNVKIFLIKKFYYNNYWENSSKNIIIKSRSQIKTASIDISSENFMTPLYFHSYYKKCV